MESKTLSPSSDNADEKPSFRKPSNDPANRKYRRRSPVSGSSSDGSPTREHSSSPIYSRDDPPRDSDPRRRDDGRRDRDKDSGRNHRGRSGDSYRNSDRQSSRSSHNYHRRDDDCVRHEKHRDEEDRNYSKLSSRSGRESRFGSQFDHTRRESDHYRSRDHLRGDDKYSRERSDGSGNRSRDKDKDSSADREGSGRRHINSGAEDMKSGERDRTKGDGENRDGKREYRRSLGDYKGDLSPVYGESWGHRNDPTSRRDSGRHRSKEVLNSDPRESDGQKYIKGEKKEHDDRETNRHKDQYDRAPGEKFADKSGFTSEDKESSKRPKFSTGTDHGKVSKFTTVADSNQAHEAVGKLPSEEAPAKGSDIANDLDAAKIAAMKAAELVNKNLIGTGYMSTDQKKKLLWGNKKNTAAEESGHRWDATMFPDRERQEKFNKLMSLRLHWYLWPIVGCEGRCEGTGAQTRQSRNHREAKGTTTAGFGEAIHCWTPSQRWPHCRTWSLIIYLGCSCATAFTSVVLYFFAIIRSFAIIDLFDCKGYCSIPCFVLEISVHDDKMCCIIAILSFGFANGLRFS